MYQVYILQSLKDYRTYTGYAKNAVARLKEHNKGNVKATYNRRPLEILLVENFEKEIEAKRREKYWKSGA